MTDRDDADLQRLASVYTEDGEGLEELDPETLDVLKQAQSRKE